MVLRLCIREVLASVRISAFTWVDMAGACGTPSIALIFTGAGLAPALVSTTPCRLWSSCRCFGGAAGLPSRLALAVTVSFIALRPFIGYADTAPCVPPCIVGVRGFP